MDTPTLHPTLTRAGTGEARWFLGALTETLLAHEATGGALSILQVTEPPGAEAPLHVHHHDDETFVILEGGVTFEVGGETIPAAAGDVAFGPRTIPHRYSVGPEGCRMLFILTPGGRFDEMIREMSVPAGTRTLPPPPDGPPDVPHIASVARAHGCELLL
ncbi:MAG: cupin domain-containing protein [Thermoleophilia bacterium]